MPEILGSPRHFQMDEGLAEADPLAPKTRAVDMFAFQSDRRKFAKAVIARIQNQNLSVVRLSVVRNGNGRCRD